MKPPIRQSFATGPRKLRDWKRPLWATVNFTVECEANFLGGIAAMEEWERIKAIYKSFQED